MERRKLPRIEVDAPLQVRILGQNSSHNGRIVNVSQSGLRFISDVSFPIGEVLQFDLADHILIGSVRYSATGARPFATGIELQNAISKCEFDALLRELKSEFVLG
jgi:hypothetical protein